MIKEKNCCSFVAKLCSKLCNKKVSESIKPDNPHVIEAFPVQIQEQVYPKVQEEEKKKVVSHKSHIITGSAKNPLSSNQFAGYVNSDAKNIENNPSESFHNKTQVENPIFFYDNPAAPKSPNEETVIQNLEEAYKMIQDVSPTNNIDDSGDKFTKVIRGFNFKAMLADESLK